MSRAEQHMYRRPWQLAVLVALAAVMGASLATTAAPDHGQDVPKGLSGLEKADALFNDQHWAEARAAYDSVREQASDWNSPVVRRAVEGSVACSLKLQLWDDGLALAERFVAETRDSFEEAVGQRFLANLYVTIPHEGTKRGGTYLRGQYTQGVYVSSWKKDRRQAVEHDERARQVLIELTESLGAAGNPDTSERRQAIEAERIGVNFDLASVLAQPLPYRWSPWGCVGWWWDVETEEESSAVDDADYEEPRWWYGNAYDRQPPTGVPLGPDGQPHFIAVPSDYSPRLGAGPKIRFLLEEIRRLDTSEKQDEAARALFRWAMVARSLYGPDVAAQWYSSRTQYDQFGRPLPQEAEPLEKQVWELTDDEAITLVGGRLRLITLPASENPIALLRLLDEEYPESTLRPEARYTLGLYYQTRQQFPQAIAEYQALHEQFSGHERASNGVAQIALIERPQVTFGTSGVYLPNKPPELAFNYCNCNEVEFTATQIDLAKYVQDMMEDTSEQWWHYRNIQWEFFNNKDDWRKYLGKEAARWSQKVPLPEGNRVGDGATDAPLTTPGAYIVEAKPVGSGEQTRTLVLVTDIAIVQKNVPGKGLIWVVDAVTGQPLAEKSVKVYEHWADYKSGKTKLRWDCETLVTNADGVIEYSRQHQKHGPQVDAVVFGSDGRLAFSFFQNWQEYDPGDYYENGSRYYVITDRPVYRPGHTVHFRVWVRHLTSGVFQKPYPGQNVTFEIYDSKNNAVKAGRATTDELGCISGEFQLGEEPPLGIWHINVNSQQPDARQSAGGLFRVEEYKKPEYEVTVKPAATQARLGEKVKARIEARYYFGAPVANADVTYKVFREDYRHVYWGPGEYDWLYGQGYGRYYYAYPWFPWWGRWGCYICCEPWWPGYALGGLQYFPWGWYGDPDSRYRHRLESGRPEALRELVAYGTARLNPDGSYEIEIDTGPAKHDLSDRDHRYTVEAEVRDASRRTIEGSGSVIVTRQEFYAFVEADGGWYQPKSQAHVNVRTLTPDNVPVAADGEVIVKRIRYGGADNSEVQEEEVRRWNASTDVDGRLSFMLPVPGEGQYRVTFRTRDSWEEEVLGNAVFWVVGPKFDGRVYRFNELEIIADKRTYEVGETAHLLINTAENNARILFSDDVSRGVLRSYRFIDIPSRALVIDIPVEKRHVPDFFVEATLVRNGRVHMESRELFVPPIDSLLNVSIRTDKPSYKPGESGTVHVEVRDPKGKPVTGQVTLTAYDQAVTYIQDEFGPDPRTFYHGQKRYHYPYVDASFDQVLPTWSTFQRAEQAWSKWRAPEGWSGWWTLSWEGAKLRSLGRDEDAKEMRADRLVASVAGRRRRHAGGRQSEFRLRLRAHGQGESVEAGHRA